jgi:hypothetical protein
MFIYTSVDRLTDTHLTHNKDNNSTSFDERIIAIIHELKTILSPRLNQEKKTIFEN